MSRSSRGSERKLIGFLLSTGASGSRDGIEPEDMATRGLCSGIWLVALDISFVGRSWGDFITCTQYTCVSVQVYGLCATQTRWAVFDYVPRR